MRLYKVSWIYEDGEAGSARVMAATAWAAKQKIFMQFIGGRVPLVFVEEIEQ